MVAAALPLSVEDTLAPNVARFLSAKGCGVVGNKYNADTHVSINRQLFEHLLDAASAAVGSLYPTHVSGQRSSPGTRDVDNHLRVTRVAQQLGDIARIVGQDEAPARCQLSSALWLLGAEIERWRAAIGHCDRAGH